MRAIFANTLDDNTPSGGAKQAYRHIDILNSLGIDAYSAHPVKGFRYNWFDNQTRIICSDDLQLTADDYLIFGELVPGIPNIKGNDRCARVIMCQNQYNALGGFRLDLMNIRHQYREAAAILCPSEYAQECLQFMFPSSRVMRFRYSFDREPWGYSDRKEKLIAVMPRKRGNEINGILAVAGVNWIPPGWNIFRMDGLSEKDVARALKQCSIFISLMEREGMGMTAAEAMACGCCVVGYDGYSGAEYMKPGISFPIRDGDFIGLTKTMIEVISMKEQERLEIGLKASSFIRSTYSTQAEVASIKECWDKITRNVVEIRTTARERMKKEVAVYMPVYNEGPYMESLLHWLVPRVGAIFVAESMVAWNPNGEPGGKSKIIVDKVIADCPDAKNVIKYLQVGDTGGTDEPLIREAKQRNEVLQKIEDYGFKFVWMVEADEFYRNDEAESMWDWFFERASEGVRTARCFWQTYWRSIHWRVDPPEMFRPNVAFVSSCRFLRGRVMRDEDERYLADVPDRLCTIRHYSWARTPADTKKKLSAWGHAKEINPEWYDKAFLAWTPGSPMENVHPTVPQSYKRVVRCNLPIPEAMEGHPFVGLDIIEDSSAHKTITVPSVEVKRPRIKAIIIHHNTPENADKLYEQLSPVFDDMEIFDNGSDPSKIPIHTTRSRENVYWTGTWNEVMKTCSDYDAVWVIGCDIELRSKPEEYRKAIEDSLPFGVWSPSIEGRAHPFMLAEYYKDGKPRKVVNIEGMAMALSGELMKKVKELVPGSPMGYGQDFWLCYRARKAKMDNIIDGRVKVFHPHGIGYDGNEAHRQMEMAFSKEYGPDFRRSIFKYDGRFEYNLAGEEAMAKKYTIVTVDNGWGLSEFMRVCERIENSRRIVMCKGVFEGMEAPGFEFVPYDESLSLLLKEADVAYFPKVGAANKGDYEKLLKAGIATVVQESCAGGLIKHMENGWMFRDEAWAHRWLEHLEDHPEDRERVKNLATAKQPEVPERCKVTVITPTYKRDPKVLARCIGSMLLQTEKNWEQVVCSDGENEEHIRKLVESVGDPRIQYRHTTVKKDGDYGNTVRAEGLAAANGEYVLFFDDDNIILPQYLEKMLAALKTSGADYSVAKIMHFGPLNEREVGKPPVVLTGDPVKLYHIDPLQVLVRADVMKKIGWDTTVGYLSDGVTLEKLAPFKIVRVDEVLGVHM